MLLLLTLVYIFHGFQSFAAPLPVANLLEESSSCNATSPVLSTPADQRSLWDILWSCLATLFACSWVSVHPNIPGPKESWWRIYLRRLELMLWTLLAPEMIISWALRQWLGARDFKFKLEELHKGGQMYQIYPQILKF